MVRCGSAEFFRNEYMADQGTEIRAVFRRGGGLSSLSFFFENPPIEIKQQPLGLTTTGGGKTLREGFYNRVVRTVLL